MNALIKCQGMAIKRRPAVVVAIILLGVFFFLGRATAEAAVICPNESLRTGFGANLPDCRAYEQVTPADKKGAFAAGIPDHVIAAEEGPGITFYSANGSSVPSTGTGSTGDYPTFLSTRGAESWTTQSLLTPQVLGVKAQFLGITPDLRYDLVQALNTDFGHPGFGLGLYLIDTTTGTVDATIVPAPDNEAESTYAFDGASKDGSKIFFETAVALTPEAHGEDNLYMWERATGQVSLVGLLPEAEGGEEPAAGSFGGAYNWFRQEPGEAEELDSGGALGLNTAAANAVAALHAISPDGDQIYFTAAGTGQLYLRVGLDTAHPTTIRVSEPNTGFSDHNPPRPSSFQEATPDGSSAFFLSSGKLAEGASTGAAEEGKDLYRFNESAPAGERLTDLTPAANLEATDGARVLGLLGVSTDGEAGYFVAKGVLPVQHPGTEGPQAGAENLYHFSEAEGQIRYDFVAILRPASETFNFPRDRSNWSPHTFTELFYQPRTSRVSGDGDVLVFTSQESLTGYQSTGSNCASGNGVTGPEYRCSEIFRFDASTDSLTCLSCSPTGEAPLGAATFESRLMFSKPLQVPEVSSQVTFANNVSGNGDHVFFQTSQPLIASDTNGNSGCARQTFAFNTPEFDCQDLYEWEAPGTPGGSCVRAEVNGGCLYLLSSGQSNEPSFFAGASSDGSNVYILTTSQLVPSDRDLASDVYDLRVDGGIAAQQVTPTGSCAGEGCLGLASSAPPATVPGSAQTEGPGNQKPRAHKKKRHKHRKKRHKHRTKKQRRAGKGKPKRAATHPGSDDKGSHGSSSRAGARR